jgi:hypothetical protein
LPDDGRRRHPGTDSTKSPFRTENFLILEIWTRLQRKPKNHIDLKKMDKRLWMNGTYSSISNIFRFDPSLVYS